MKQLPMELGATSGNKIQTYSSLGRTTAKTNQVNGLTISLAKSSFLYDDTCSMVLQELYAWYLWYVLKQYDYDMFMKRRLWNDMTRTYLWNEMIMTCLVKWYGYEMFVKWYDYDMFMKRYG